MDADLVPNDAWLSQGDVFGNVPCPVPAVGHEPFGWQTEMRPALLLTSGCQLDKRSLERLHFAPLISLARLAPHEQALVMNDKLTPYDTLRIALYGEEHFCRLSHTSWLPVEHFGASTFVEVDASEPKRRCLPEATRLGSIAPARRDLLLLKLSAFWTGTVPQT